MAALLIDTHAAIWIVAGVRLRSPGHQVLQKAFEEGGIVFSAVCAWEIGLLAAKGRLHLAVSAEQWVERFLRIPGVINLPLTVEAALGSSRLPGTFHADPADRLLVATARVEGIPIATRDERILAYAAAGHVKAVAC